MKLESSIMGNVIEYNNIYNNREYDLENYQSENVTVENNYWGTINVTEIEDKIWDYYDYNEVGIVDFEPFLTEFYIDTTPPEIIIQKPINEEIITTDSVTLEVTTNENAICHATLCKNTDDPKSCDWKNSRMPTTGEKVHSNLFTELENTEDDEYYQATVRCSDYSSEAYSSEEIIFTVEENMEGFVCPSYTEGIVVHEITSNNQYAVPDNTYENGWNFTFFVTVPETEDKLAMWIDDWINDTNATVQTNDNTKIVYDGNDYAVGSEHDYSNSDYFVTEDEYPSCPGRQVYFDVLVKLPETTEYGTYHTSYGIKSEENEI